MGRFHPIDGQFLSGNGGAISVDGNVLHEKGSAAQWWFDHELNLWTALAQINDGGEAWRVATYRNGSWVTILPHGANEIQTGGDLYLAMFNGQPFSNVPLEPGMVIPPTHGEGRGYGAPDSTIAVRPWAELPGLILRRRHAEEGFTVPGVSFAPMNVDVINRDQVTCDDGAGRFVGFGMKLGELLPRPARIRYRVVDQQPWVTYYTAQHELYVSHPVNDLEHGRIIPDRICFHHDVGFRGGRLFFGASRGKQELPNENILHDILDLDVTNLRDLDGGHPDEPVVAIGRDCYVCWFEHEAPPANQEHHPPGNALLRIYAHSNFAQIATLDGQQVFNTAGLGPAETVEGIEATVAASPLPCYVYWDANGWPRWPQVRPQDFVDVRAYWTPGLSLAALEADVRARLAAAPAGPWLSLTCQCFNNPGASADLQALVPMYSRVVRDNPRIRMVVVFNDAGRGNTGLAGNPDVRPLWEQLFAGVTGIPDSGEPPVSIRVPFTSEEKALLDQMAVKYADLRTGDDDARREFTKMNAQTLKARFGKGWGNKNAGGGRPQSKDALARWVFEDGSEAPEGQGLVVFADTINGATREMMYPDMTPLRDEPGDQVYMSVDPKDWLNDQPQPGSLNVLILDYDKTVRRSDPKGMLIRFEVESDQPVIEVTLDLVEDGEPEIPITFKAARSQDGRYVRALAFKPTVNGDFTLRVSAKDAAGRTGSTDGPEPVHVSP
jgi:hypothetical protein